MLLEHVVSLVNLGMRRTGLAPGTEDERDPEQVRLAIEAVRAVLPLLEQTAPQQVGPIRDALSQLQLAFVKIGGAPGGARAGRSAGPGSEPAGRRRRAARRRPSPSPASPAPRSAAAGSGSRASSAQVEARPDARVQRSLLGASAT